MIQTVFYQKLLSICKMLITFTKWAKVINLIIIQPLYSFNKYLVLDFILFGNSRAPNCLQFSVHIGISSPKES